MDINREIEERIHEIFDSADVDADINPLLKELYQETKYAGVLYWMAYNYEEGLYGVLDEQEAMHYYVMAAKEGYIDAMIWLVEYYLDEGKDELFIARYWGEKVVACCDSLYARYLLSKIYFLEAVYYNTYGMYRKGLRIMNELADNDYYPAQEFLQIEEGYDNENIDFSFSLEDLL